MSRINSLLEWILRLPFVWGGVASLAFYAALNQKWIDSPLLDRYMAGHPVEFVIGTMFFIGLAALGIRFFDLTSQFAAIGRVSLSPPPAGGTPVSACDRLIVELDAQTEGGQQNYLARRLREALDMVRRKDSADSIEQHLRYLEDQDALRMQANYSLVRIVIWAIPILGLLGTVIGITMAIANLDPETLEQSMSHVTKGLGVAFDHTAEALTLTMLLMFLKHAVEKSENRLLAVVDARAAEELIGRFQYSGQESDPNVAAVRRMSEQVIAAVESSAARQAQVWQTSIEETHQQWADVSTSAGRIVNESLSAALRENIALLGRQLSDAAQQHAIRLGHSADETLGRLRQGLERLAELLVEALHRHGEIMSVNEKELAEENRKHLSEVEAALGEAMVVASDRQEQLIRRSEDLLKEMQIALVTAAEATVRQQEQLVKQGDVLLRVVDATGQVKLLEEALNENLATLGQAKHFDELVLNLTAAIQMLCARAGYAPQKLGQVADAVAKKPTSHAA